MALTPNIGLHVYTDAELEAAFNTVRQWRSQMSGNSNSSDFYLIDQAIGELQTKKTIEVVQTLPTASQTEYDKHLLYSYQNILYFIIYDNSTYSYIQVGNGTTVVANPTLSGGESDLTSIEIEDTKYAIPSGTEVIANPILVGTEDDITSIEIDGVKYKISSGGSGGGSKVHLYRHTIDIPYNTTIDSEHLIGNFRFHIYSEVTTYTKNELIAHLNDLSLGYNYTSNVSTSSTTTQASYFIKSGNSIYIGGIIRLNNVTYYPRIYFDKPYNNFTFTDTVTELELEVEGGGGGSGTTVTANPTLDGTETALSGLEVDGVKYSVGGGSTPHLYRHVIQIQNPVTGSLIIENDNNTPFTFSSLQEFLTNEGYITFRNLYPFTGVGGSTASNRYYSVGLYSVSGVSTIWTINTHSGNTLDITAIERDTVTQIL